MAESTGNKSIDHLIALIREGKVDAFMPAIVNALATRPVNDGGKWRIVSTADWAAVANTIEGVAMRQSESVVDSTVKPKTASKFGPPVASVPVDLAGKTYDIARVDVLGCFLVGTMDRVKGVGRKTVRVEDNIGKVVWRDHDCLLQAMVPCTSCTTPAMLVVMMDAVWNSDAADYACKGCSSAVPTSSKRVK